MTNKSIIDNIYLYMKAKGFYYDINTLYSLYLSLKTKPFVILSGQSGSGKTSLARLFSDALGANTKNGRFKFISVESNWDTPKRLMGYMNTDGKFVPGILTPFIQDAISNPEFPYFVCLDELNLSKPEEFMSPVLSAIETRDFNDEGKIVSEFIYDKTSFGSDLSSVYSYSGVYFPENLYIIATINSDDVSYDITNKVLDRANVIELKSDDISFEFIPEMNKTIEKYELIEVTNDFLKSEYLRLNDLKSDIEYLSQVSIELEKINICLKDIGSSISLRARDEILIYTFYSRKFSLLTDNECFDFTIMQKVLPKIKGSLKYIPTSLKKLYELTNYKDHSDNSDLTKSISKLNSTQNTKVKYQRSRNKISDMIRRFEIDGQTSFWLWVWKRLIW